MSGSFESFLNCRANEVPSAVVQVLRGSKNAEIGLRLRSGRLSREPRVAVVVQQMVSPVRMAGTVFLPAPRDPSTFLAEARWGQTGEGLMDGRVQPDVVARFNGECGLVHLDCAGVALPNREVVAGDCVRLAAEAMAIYCATGRGDLEFAVGTDGTIWWLQARPLNMAVEVIDRRGFHPAAVAYYRQMAFRVAEANQTPAAHFRCFDLEDGIFGYSLGIRHRDRAFHAKVREDAEHLARVTAFGWDVRKAHRRGHG